MNREIKFRVWDNRNNHWLTSDDPTIELLLFEGSYIYQREKDITLLQYTGLHDKNGVEIYEGDIVERKCEVIIRRTVEWGECYFVFKSISDSVEDIPEQKLITYLGYEVIGNIYETPELLEVKE